MAVIGAPPARLDIGVYGAEPVDFSVPVLQSSGQPVETLAGWSAAAQVRADPATDLLFAFTVAIEGVAVRVSATSTQTAAWTFTAAQWDLVLTGPGGVLVPLVAGWVRRHPTITHS